MSLIFINATHADNPSDLLGCSRVCLGDSFHSSTVLFSSSINHLFGTGPDRRSSRTLGRLIFCKSQPLFRLWLGAQMGMVFWRLQLMRRLCAAANSISTPTTVVLISFSPGAKPECNRMGGKNVEWLKFGLQELAPASNSSFRYCFLTVIILDLCVPES